MAACVSGSRFSSRCPGLPFCELCDGPHQPPSCPGRWFLEEHQESTQPSWSGVSFAQRVGEPGFPAARGCCALDMSGWDARSPALAPYFEFCSVLLYLGAQSVTWGSCWEKATSCPETAASPRTTLLGRLGAAEPSSWLGPARGRGGLMKSRRPATGQSAEHKTSTVWGQRHTSTEKG